MSDQDYDDAGTAVEDDGEQEAQHPAPPPRHYPRQPQGYGPPMGSPPQRVGHGVPRGFAPRDRRGPRPLDLITRSDETFLRVSRVKVSKDADEDEVGTGYCGNVQDIVGFEDEIAKKWGGGLYEVAGLYEGKQRVESVKIAGESQPIRKEKEEEGESDEDDDDDSYSYSYPERSYSRGRRFGQRSYGGYGRGGYDSYNDPYDSYGGSPYGQPSPYDSPYGRTPYGQASSYGQPPYGAPNPYVPQPYGQPQVPYGQAPYGQAPYGQAPYGPQPFPGMPGMQPVPGQPPNVYQPVPQVDKEKEDKRAEEMERMRAEIEAAREAARAAADEAAAEREERRLDQERAAAHEREAELKREMDRMKAENDRKLDLIKQQADKQAELMQRAIEESARRAEEQNRQFMQQIAASQNSGPSSLDKMMEMQMLQLQATQARAESERLEREARAREEQAIRREEQANKNEEYRRERERQDKLRAEEREREERRRSDSEKHYQHLMEMSQKGQQTPEQMLGMLKTMVDMSPKENATEKVMELANAALAMREILGGNQEQESKWERIIKTGGEALSGAIGKIQQSKAQQAPVYQQVPGYQSPQALPGPTPQQQAMLQQRQQAMMAQHQAMAQAQGAASVDRDPEPEDWGKILKFVVDCHDGENDPEETASHLHAMVVNGMGLPRAIERLGKVTVPELKFQLSMMGLAPQVAASEFKPKIDRLIEVIDTEEGQAWMEELIEAIGQIEQTIREAQMDHVQQQAYAQQAQAMQQQAMQQQVQQFNASQGGTPEQQAYAQKQFAQHQRFMQQQAAQQHAMQQRAQGMQPAQFQPPQAAPPERNVESMTSEEFRAQATGVELSQEEDTEVPEGGSSEDFARRARGEQPPPPKNEWDEGVPPQ